MLAASSVYDHPLFKAVLTLHVLAAILWVGGGVVLGLFGVIERSQDDAALTVAFLRKAGRVRMWCFLPASFVLLGCGFGLVGLLHLSLATLWLDLALGGWFACLGLSTSYLVPKTEELVHPASNGFATGDITTMVRRIRLVASLESIVLVLVVIDMVTRP